MASSASAPRGFRGQPPPRQIAEGILSLFIEIEMNKTTCAENHTCDEKQTENFQYVIVFDPKISGTVMFQSN